jgi:hypothetical protein
MLAIEELLDADQQLAASAKEARSKRRASDARAPREHRQALGVEEALIGSDHLIVTGDFTLQV